MAIPLKKLIEDRTLLPQNRELTGGDLNEYHPDNIRATQKRDAKIIIYGYLIDNVKYAITN